ncbi:MAG TPA: hypothetical protein VF350_06620 [Candidatus Bathyarchaeia archaeon]
MYREKLISFFNRLMGQQNEAGKVIWGHRNRTEGSIFTRAGESKSVGFTDM